MTNESLLKIVEDGLKGDIATVTALFKLKEELTENIRVELLKKSGTKSNDVTIIKRITKESKQNPKFDKAHEFEIDGIKYFGFLEGHYILASENDFGYEHANDSDRFNINALINSDMFYNTKIEVDMIDLKMVCKTQKKSDKTPYIITVEGTKIGVNPFYLLDVVQFNDTDKIIVNDKNPHAPIMVKNDIKKTIGMVLPVRLKD